MKPYYEDNYVTLYNGDCREIVGQLLENSVDGLVSDPPYELGFMGKAWDKTGIANDVEVWKQAVRVLKPGGHLLAFSGTRTYHRMASAIEDAGFEVRDMIEWIYGSGFPKSLNIGKAVDKLQNNEREIIETRIKKAGDMTSGNFKRGGDYLDKELTKTKGTSEWEGWGTALKPAHEPICMARKPISEKTVAENCLKWGTGGINIDESRVGTTGARNNGNSRGTVGSNSIGVYGKAIKQDYNMGRFPANIIHDNSDEVKECFPDSKSSNAIRKNRKDNFKFFSEGEKHTAVTSFGFNDSGNASRFFKSIIYTAKASKSERGEENNHPTVKPVALLQYLIKMITKPNAIILDPFAGSGTTGVAAKLLNRKCVMIEMEEKYCEIAARRCSQEVLPLA